MQKCSCEWWNSTFNLKLTESWLLKKCLLHCISITYVIKMKLLASIFDLLFLDRQNVALPLTNLTKFKQIWKTNRRNVVYFFHPGCDFSWLKYIYYNNVSLIRMPFSLNLHSFIYYDDELGVNNDFPACTRFIGIGKIIVELCSAAMLLRVCR